jgi:hypothetical protein
MPASHDPQQNHLLAALSPAERDRLYPHLRLVPMPLGKVLYESGDVLHHVYFPTNCIVSLLYVLADGASAEISVVGNEGLIGIALFMGGETTPSRAIVQSAGHAYRLIGLPSAWAHSSLHCSRARPWPADVSSQTPARDHGIQLRFAGPVSAPSRR